MKTEKPLPEKKVSRARLIKPRELPRRDGRGLYAGIEENHTGHPIYVGGDYYGNSAQIHLFTDEAERLGQWLLKAAKYLREKP